MRGAIASKVVAMDDRVTNFFDVGSPWLQHPLLTDQRSAKEIDEIERLVPSLSTRSHRVLDIGCGFGRHAIELARRGHLVVACDPSKTMIDAARERSAEAEVTVDFRQTRGQAIDTVAKFDIALCVFTTLGQRSQMPAANDDSNNNDDEVLIERIARALVPSGHAVIEVPNRERTVEALVVEEMLGDTRVTRAYDKSLSVIAERFELATGEAFNLAYRVFSRAELSAMVRDAGLEIVASADQGLAPPPFTFMTVLAQRPE